MISLQRARKMCWELAELTYYHAANIMKELIDEIERPEKQSHVAAGKKL